MLHLQNATCRMSVAAERGAIVTSLAVKDREVLYLDQATFDDSQKNVRGGIPVLFPICGPLAQADYEWEGRRYSMKQHGFGRTQAWKVLEQHPTRVVLELVDDDTTRAQYPFAFSYKLDFGLLEDGLRVEQTIANLGGTPMPAQFGFHPYFLVGDKERLTFDLPVTVYSDNKSKAGGPFPGFDFASSEIDWAFPHPSARAAGFRDPDRGLSVRVEYGQEYKALVFWTLLGQSFLCLEPWSSDRLAFPHGAGVHRVDPAAVLQTSMAIRVGVDSDH